jgi:hypothetical protein
MVVLFRVSEFKDDLFITKVSISLFYRENETYLDIRVETFLTELGEISSGFKSDTVDTLFSLVSFRQQSRTTTIIIGLTIL